MLAHADDGLIKAALAGLIVSLLTDVPFAEHARRVTCGLELLGNDVAVERQFGDVVHGPQRAFAPIEAIRPADGVDPGPSAVLTAHQRGSSRRAILAMMMAQELHPLHGEPVDVRRLVILAAETSHIRVTEIVGHDEDDVRPLRRNISGVDRRQWSKQQGDQN